MHTRLLPIAVFALAAFLTGCATNTARYTFVYLKTGPESSHKTAEESRTIFQGHMANMRRLADEKKLIVAGPFDKPADPAWRGIFIFDVADIAVARELVKTDSGIISGVFIQDTHPFASTPDLRKMPELEASLKKLPPNPQEAPKNIRGYVMITAANAARAKAAIAGSSLGQNILFSGTLTDTDTAVFVLDATAAADVQEAISRDQLDLGPCSIDGWWSSTALANLKTH